MIELQGAGYNSCVNPFQSADASDRFCIYLNDHRALLAAERALAERSREANAGSDLGHLLRTVAVQNEADQVVLDRLLERVGGSPNPVKRIGALIGERLGRLKLNGQLTGYSPLSRLIEIESLLASTAMRRAMWNAVAAMAIEDQVTIDAAMRAETADEQHVRLGEHHVEAVLIAFEDES